MEFKAFVFDLDDTLYRVEGIPELVRTKIGEYMTEKLGFPKENVSEVTTSLYMKHGTTLAGLVASGYKIDFDDWHRFVHYEAIGYDNFLKPDPTMRDFLNSITVPKYIMTNADVTHMTICLKKLGIYECFDGFYHFEKFLDFAEERKLFNLENPGILCKPSPDIYKYVAEDIGVVPEDIIFFDDSIRNLQGAHEAGMSTVLVGKNIAVTGADVAVADLYEFPVLLPQLLGNKSSTKPSSSDSHHEHQQLDEETSTTTTVTTPA
mmetsp:Transcript_19929/g.35868  ORF Transcript_19929/g.35868 Transcript_19929/m.35868 type:complete len:263 (-) Transcript_19929:97-885(-)